MRHDRLGLNNISLQDAAAFWEMQLLPNDCLPAIATHALAEGYDSPSLRRLAGETETLASTLGPLFTKALTEPWGWPSITLEEFLMTRFHRTKELD